MTGGDSPDALDGRFEAIVRRRLERTYGRYAGPVVDSRGIHRIGVGFDLDAPEAATRLGTVAGVQPTGAGVTELSEAAIDALLDDDLRRAITVARAALATFDELSEARRFVVVDIAFDLGGLGLSEFRGLMNALQGGRFLDAEQYLRRSCWCALAPQRGDDDCEMLRTGEWPVAPSPAFNPQSIRDPFSRAALIIPYSATGSPPITPRNYLVLRRGKFDATGPAELNDAFESFTASGRKRLAIFFHGGLVDEAAGIANARALLESYEKLGNAYPLFFIWKSGFGDVLRDHLPEIVQEAIFGRVAALVSSFIQLKTQPMSRILPFSGAGPDFVSAQVEATLAWSNVDEALLRTAPEPEDEDVRAFARAVNEDPVVVRELSLIAGSITPAIRPYSAASGSTIGVRASDRTLMSPAVVASIAASLSQDRIFRAFGFGDMDWPLPSAPDFGSLVATIGLRIFKRYRERRDHGMPCTLVEEIVRVLYIANAGYAIWKAMKDDTAAAFGQSKDCGGTAVVDHILRLARGGASLDVTLLGHSAGSIYACNILAAVDDALKGEQVDLRCDVVLMAPAVTMDLFDQTIAARGQRIRDVRVFEMHDELECRDAILGSVYPRSLLYFVSGVCENETDQPLLGMERYLSGSYDNASRFPAVSRVKSYLSGPRICRSKTGMTTAGQQTDAVAHGGFPHERLTLSSCEEILRHGL